MKNNLIEFPQQKDKEKLLSDEDIKSLFLGLVKIVKQNATEKANNEVNDKLEIVNTKLREKLVENCRNLKKIEDLNEQNKELKEEIKLLKNKINKLRSMSLEKLQQ